MFGGIEVTTAAAAWLDTLVCDLPNAKKSVSSQVGKGLGIMRTHDVSRKQPASGDFRKVNMANNKISQELLNLNDEEAALDATKLDRLVEAAKKVCEDADVYASDAPITCGHIAQLAASLREIELTSEASSERTKPCELCGEEADLLAACALCGKLVCVRCHNVVAGDYDEGKPICQECFER